MLLASKYPVDRFALSVESFCSNKIQPSVMSIQKPLKLIEELSAQHKFCQGRNDGICHGHKKTDRTTVNLNKVETSLMTDFVKMNIGANPLFPPFINRL